MRMRPPIISASGISSSRQAGVELGFEFGDFLSDLRDDGAGIRPSDVRYAAFRLAGVDWPADVQALPSAPKRPIHVHDEPDRPQPRRDRGLERGMAVSVGRPRLGDDGRTLRFVCLGSNTVRGAVSRRGFTRGSFS